jgi:hypothetical protein
MTKLIQKYHFLLFCCLVSQISVCPQVMSRLYDMSQLQKNKNSVKQNDKEFQKVYQIMLSNAD